MADAEPRPRHPGQLAVRFTRQWQQYYPGDVATFPARMATGLVSRRFAQRVDILDGPAPSPGLLAMRGPGRHVSKDGTELTGERNVGFDC
jgi:hypothetical protein